MSAKRILLTGANGFVGSHILDQLLTHGHSVRAVVRSQSKASQVLADFPNYASRLDFGIVPDIASPGAFNDAVLSERPFDIVIHTASPFLYKVISSNKEFLNPAINGTTEILKAIKARAPSVKRVVITSSCAAVVDFSAPPVTTPQKVYTEDDWNPTTYENALTGTPNAGYQASKKFAEQAAWDFVENEKPNFDLVTLTPPMVYGPLRHTITSVKELNESNARIYNLFLNGTSSSSPLPPNGMHVYTDVRDLAHAHVLAATVPEASGQRFVISVGQVSSQDIADVLREVPELKDRTPEGVKGGNKLEEGSYTCSSEKAKNALGLTFRGKEETFGDLGRQLLEIERKEKA